MRKQPLLQTDNVNVIKLQPLRGMNGHQIRAVVVAFGIRRAFQRDIRQELADFLRGRRAITVLKLRGGGDQFVQVFNALNFLLVFIMRAQSALFNHRRHQRGERVAGAGVVFGVPAQVGDERFKPQQIRVASSGERGKNVRRFGERRQRALANLARRKINHPQQHIAVIGDEQAQIRKATFDFGAVIKTQAAIDAIGDAVFDKLRFKLAALRVGAIENAAFAQRRAALSLLRYRAGDGVGFGFAGVVTAHADFAAALVLGRQVFADAVFVVGDERVCHCQNVADRAIVSLQADEVSRAQLALKPPHNLRLRAAKGVDRLVVVADAKIAVVAGVEQFEPLKLDGVGVLQFVNEDVRKAARVAQANLFVAAPQVERRQQQFGEVQFVLAARGDFVTAIDVVELPLLWVRLRRLRRALPFFFGGINVVADALRRKQRRVNVLLSEQAADERQLVLHIQNVKIFVPADRVGIDAQNAVADAVKSAKSQTRRGQFGVDARAHFFGGFVGEGDRHDVARGGESVVQQMDNARGEDAGLAGARAGDNQHARRIGRHRLLLFRIQHNTPAL